jgi:hypothetical protein
MSNSKVGVFWLAILLTILTWVVGVYIVLGESRHNPARNLAALPTTFLASWSYLKLGFWLTGTLNSLRRLLAVILWCSVGALIAWFIAISIRVPFEMFVSAYSRGIFVELALPMFYDGMVLALSASLFLLIQAKSVKRS